MRDGAAVQYMDGEMKLPDIEEVSARRSTKPGWRRSGRRGCPRASPRREELMRATDLGPDTGDPAMIGFRWPGWLGSIDRPRGWSCLARREEPNARSQASFGRNEGESKCGPGPRTASRARTAA